MTETSHGASGGDSTGSPDAASGDTPSEADLPGLQGLDDGTSRQDEDAADPNTPGAPDAGAAAAAAGEGGDPAGASDPMPDVGGAGRP